MSDADEYQPLAAQPSETHGLGEPDSSDFNIRYLDDLFSYETQKVVVIRDRRLGCLYYFICSVIFCYVVIFQILYCNEHFPRKSVTGNSRLLIQQPTQGNCDPENVGCKSDFQNLEDLPYCKEYTKGEKLAGAKPCVFADRNSIAPNGMLEAHLLIPTQVISTVQNKGCEPTAKNGHSCDNEYDTNGTSQTAYVADIERYMLHISHSYTRIHLTDGGVSDSARGYYLECDKNGEGDGGSSFKNWAYDLGQIRCDGKVNRKEVKCLTEACPFLKGEDDDKSLLQKASSLVMRGRKLGASLLTHAAKSLYPHEKHGKHDVDPTISQHQGHRHHKHHRKKLVRTPYAIDAKGAIHLETTSDGNHSRQAIEANVAQIGSQGKALLEGVRHQSKENPGVRETGIWGEPGGDVITIQKILDLCDVSLDSTRNQEGIALREAGTVIEIEAYYSNLHPWVSTFGDTTVEYEYRVTRRPVETFSNSVFSKYQPNFPAQRIVEDRFGLYVIVKVGGEFGDFSLVYCLVLIASSTALMRVAVLLVDKIALYFMRMKELYNDSKYQYTERVYDMQKNLEWLTNLDVGEDSDTPGSLAEEIAPGRSSTARASTADSGAGGF